MIVLAFVSMFWVGVFLGYRYGKSAAQRSADIAKYLG